MRDYNPGKYQFAFIWSLKGSVFPRACAYAVPAGILASSFKLLENYEVIGSEWFFILENNAAYSGFSFVVGFLLIFRTSQAYSRFWDGATKVNEMRSKWCDAFSSLVAFSRVSKSPKADILRFQHTLLRLFSLMHSLALQRLHGLHDETFDLIDVEGLEEHTVKILEETPVTDRVDIVAMWIQQLMVDNLDTGILNVPAPIQSRVFQEMSNGMLAFNNTLKIATTPFPFPYAQMTTVLLLFHLMLTPLLMIEWTSGAGWAFAWSFTVVLGSWCINFIAVELEQPFGGDINDLPTHEMQQEMNEGLLVLVDPRISRLPNMKDIAQWDIGQLRAQYCTASLEIDTEWQTGDANVISERRRQQLEDVVGKVENVLHIKEPLSQIAKTIGEAIPHARPDAPAGRQAPAPQATATDLRDVSEVRENFGATLSSSVSGGGREFTMTSQTSSTMAESDTGYAVPQPASIPVVPAAEERREKLKAASAPQPLTLPAADEAASPLQADGQRATSGFVPLVAEQGGRKPPEEKLHEPKHLNGLTGCTLMIGSCDASNGRYATDDAEGQASANTCCSIGAQARSGENGLTNARRV